jgi:hypothetical protein
LDRLSPADPETAQTLARVGELNPYGVEARYPGDFGEMTAEEVTAALALVTMVRDQVRKQLQETHP